EGEAQILQQVALARNVVLEEQVEDAERLGAGLLQVRRGRGHVEAVPEAPGDLRAQVADVGSDGRVHLQLVVRIAAVHAQRSGGAAALQGKDVGARHVEV